MMPKQLMAGLLAALLLTGCATSQPTHYYDLAALPAPVVGGVNRAVRLGIGPVTLPQVLDQPGVVSRIGVTGVQVASFHIWAGDLEPAFTRTLAASVAQQLQLEQVWPAPWDNRFRPEYQVRVFVERFSGTLNGAVELQLTWSLLGDEGQRLITTKRYHGQRTSQGGYAGYVDSLNQLLGEFSQHVANELSGRLPR